MLTDHELVQSPELRSAEFEYPRAFQVTPSRPRELLRDFYLLQFPLVLFDLLLDFVELALVPLRLPACPAVVL